MWALLGSIFIAITRLVVLIIVGENVRLAGTIVTEIEIPVLAVVPDYQPLQLATARPRVILAAMLAITTLCAQFVFVLAFG